MTMQTQSKKLPLLGAALGVQLVIALVLFWQSSDPVKAINEPLLSFDKTTVNHVKLEGDEKTLDLHKDGERWKLANGLPVVKDKVEGLLGQLADFKSQWPVANTDSAAKRFEVTDDQFHRKISLMDGDKTVGTVLFGTSPGFNQNHVRIPGSDDIYALRFSIFEANVDQDSWLDNDLMRPEGDLLSVSSADYDYQYKDGKWLAAGDVDSPAVAAESKTEDDQAAAEPNSTSDTKKEAEFDIAAFSNTLSELRVMGVATDIAQLDAPEVESNADDKSLGLIKWSVKTASGEHQYQLLNKGDQYYIRRDDYDATFRISKYHYDKLSTIKKHGLSVAQK